MAHKIFKRVLRRIAWYCVCAVVCTLGVIILCMPIVLCAPIYIIEGLLRKKSRSRRNSGGIAVVKKFGFDVPD